ncbi:MAG: hypothetical protein ACE5HU_10125, partial [Acidobacteriota bacterium]
RPNKDGTLPEERLVRNLGLIKERDPREILIRGLEGYMAAILAAVRRILGFDHEETLVHKLKDLRCSRT